jgi:hypothetical protein
VRADAGILVCLQYTGSSFTAQAVQQDCAAAGGTSSTGLCPGAMRVGGCIQNVCTATETVGYYYRGVFQGPLQVQQMCMLNNQTYIQ